METGFVVVAIESQKWLSIGGGDSSDILERLEIPRLPNVEIGPSRFTIAENRGYVLLEIRRDDFPGDVLTLERTRQFMKEHADAEDRG